MASGTIALGCALALVALCACENSDGSVFNTGGSGGMVLDGSNGSGGVLNGSGTGAVNDNCGSDLTGTVRDFQEAHPDFEYLIEPDPGIVQELLGSDAKPVYTGTAGNPTTTGQANFDQWYRDVGGVNIALPLTVSLVNGGNGIYTYDNPAFFPIDGQGFDNEGHPHNYHFTFELHTKFRYHGGEVFSFRGDDDLFVFVNGRLAIDLGGVHGAVPGSVDLDANAALLGITPGNIYSLDFFFAERHTTESNFRIETTIDEFVDCGEPIE